MLPAENLPLEVVESYLATLDGALPTFRGCLAFNAWLESKLED
jgi:hypothetical protein